MAKANAKTNYQDVGDATESLHSSSHDLGQSDAQDVKQKITLAEDLDLLLTGGTKRVQCRITLILQEVSSDMSEKIINLIDKTDVPATQISALLTRHGYSVGRDSVQRHRRRLQDTGCRCPK